MVLNDQLQCPVPCAWTSNFEFQNRSQYLSNHKNVLYRVSIIFFFYVYHIYFICFSIIIMIYFITSHHSKKLNRVCECHLKLIKLHLFFYIMYFLTLEFQDQKYTIQTIN